METTWKKIWDNRSYSVQNYSIEDLLKINGYDQPQSVLTPETIHEACKRYSQVMNVSPGDTIYEVGCGSGATLHYFKSRGHVVGGSDLSESLVEIAKQSIGGSFTKNEANQLPCKTKWDHVISFGTFFYFPDLDYAGDVLIRMLIKAKFSVSIFDIPDEEKKDACEIRRRELIGPSYDDKYKGLQHLYIPKEWWKIIGDSLGIETIIYDQEIPGYENGNFRYNVTYLL